VVISSEMPELLGITDRHLRYERRAHRRRNARGGRKQEKIMRAIVRGEGKAA